MMEKIILWGRGGHTQDMLRNYHVPMDMIEMVVDSNEELQGTVFWGHSVESPKAIKDKKGISSKTVVIGTKNYYQEVLEQFNEMETNLRPVYIDDFVCSFFLKGKDTTADYGESEKAEYLAQQIQNVGCIPQAQLENAKVLASRDEAIKRLPKGGKAAEIGVAYGDFTDVILREMKPEHFYAIDYFNKENPFACLWGRQDLVESGMMHEEWYRHKYAKEIANDKMTVCSGLSWECLAEFEDNYFDFLYIDACHDYESIRKDIEVSVRKIKSGGVIQFNDYTIWDIIARTYYGVVPAVNKMIRETGAEVLFYCMNPLGYCDIAVRINKENGSPYST